MGVVTGESAIKWVNFLCIPSIFCSLCNIFYDKVINKLKKKEAEGVATDPTDSALLCEIRDLLKK